jgi:hypothetical protein
MFYRLFEIGKLFPLRRCRRCTRIFPRQGRSEYCSKACRSAASEGRRADRLSKSSRKKRLRREQLTRAQENFRMKKAGRNSRS